MGAPVACLGGRVMLLWVPQPHQHYITTCDTARTLCWPRIGGLVALRKAATPAYTS